uniref:DJ-1/PfpI domain-containing protein n=1 Tax=Salix viminalis TaxID=40686 RepID=A0A6N2MCS0_SALVM
MSTLLRHVIPPPHSLLYTTSKKSKLNIPSFRNRPFSFSSIKATAATPMASTTKKVLVPIANGTEPIEAVITIDVLRRGGADVTVASIEKQTRVDATHDVKLVADSLLSECSDAVFDLITLPGGLPGATNLKNCQLLEKLVKKQVEDGKLYAAVCASPAVAFGSWGLLNGLRATCHPLFMDELKSSGAITVESRVHEEGNVVTSRGPGTTMEFAVALVEKLFGKEKADEGMRSNHGDEYSIKELNPMQWTFDNVPRVLVPVANGTEEMEAIIIIDILRRAKVNVVVASVEDNLEILASRKVKLEADMLLDEAAKLSYDLIVLPGGLGGAQAFAKSEQLVNMLKKQRESNRPYGAMCASPALVLEPHGLLKGKKATAFPAMCNKLSDPSEIENRVVVDGNLITSRGPGSTMEFALGMVEKFFGRDKALELAKPLLFTHP